MEESAHWHEGSIVPQRRQASGDLALDVTLQERIRSLLLSRNEKRPPTTPCPTPDYKYLSLHPLQFPIGNSLAPVRTHRYSTTKAAARLETFNSLDQVMGATRFDGPAGQFDEGDPSQSRRHSTTSKMPSDRISLTEERRSSTVSGVNHNSRGDLLGRKLSATDSLNRIKTTRPKRPTQMRTPRISYTLRTVPPQTIKRIDQQLPTNVLSSPNHLFERDPEMESLLADSDCSVSRNHHGPLSSASDALNHIQGHGAQPIRSATAEPGLVTDNEKAHKVEIPEYQVTELDLKRDFAKLQEPNLEPAGAQLAEILAQLPPLRKDESSVLSLQSVRLDADDAATDSEASLLPKPPSDKCDGVEKLSPVSRALSLLSNMSSTSGLRGPNRRSTPKENHTLANRDNERQADSSPTLITEDQESSWYRKIIGKPSSNSFRPSNLTTRPLQRKKKGAAMPSQDHVNTESTDDALIVQRQQQTGESFQKVIGDLEALLKEALDIAGRASRDNSEVDSAPPQALRNSYRHLSAGDSDGQSSTSVASDEEKNRQGHVVVMEPEDKDLYQGHFTKARNATPFPRSLASTRQQSTVPPLDAEDSKQEQVMPMNGVPLIANSNLTDRLEPFASVDWALTRRLSLQPPKPPAIPSSLQVPIKEQHSFVIRDHRLASNMSGTTSKSRQRLPIHPRGSSMKLQARPFQKRPPRFPAHVVSDEESQSTSGPYVADFKNSTVSYHPVYREVMPHESSTTPANSRSVPARLEENVTPLRQQEPQGQEQGHSHPTRDEIRKGYSLKGLHHFEIREPHGFSLSRSHRRAPIARDWGTSRKRFVATITCLNTALLGLIIGIYAGEVPAIQYAVADDQHVVILGNVVFFLGLAITTALFWPLPLLHGRRPYTTSALTILLLLLFPQALAINGNRNPYVATYRTGLLVPRAIAGLVMGFANMNLKTTLLDLFGASLQSGNPHQEIVNEYDVRRHGGGMGVWLGIWTWCSVGSIGIGFWIGASIISGLQVSWGFWILIILTATVLLLNVLTPETRRSAYRRSMAEVRSGTDVSRRIARGEVKMHLNSTGPIWWWEEVWAGHVLCIRMLKQPGFAVLTLYLGWIYGQVVFVIVVSMRPSAWLKVTDGLAASGRFVVQVLLLSPTICRALNCNHTVWGPFRDTLPKSLTL